MTSSKTRGSKSPGGMQATLPFRSTKLGAIETKLRKSSSLRQVYIAASSSSSSESSGSTTSDDDDTQAPASRSKRIARGSTAKTKEKQVIRDQLDLMDRAGKYRKLYGLARAQTGGHGLIHGEDKSKIHHILTVFDNTYEYGPCVGVTRLERWERAEEMGLDPPPEIRDILLTQQGVDDDEIKYACLNDEV